ncbi:spindle assembly checkpoint kinase [Amniculicola lignicola CBS 123094]|uniref:EKC/KEOPS complex subunit BUD32 n=1 Tax=Amniculicola lignicola CBS 123094 TaxID=1392246 RepID=A0A6A5WC63_9PLEO|nr:spindle assembly checkpoint kinase [Amniculicola lignicola CBS 123094]
MQESVIQWPLGLDGKDLVGAGISGIVVRLDAVVKFYKPSQLHFLEREKLIYQRLGRDHRGIVRYFGALENAIILQFASHTSIRQYLIRQNKQVPLFLRLRWVEQLIDAVRFIHSRGVLHGDISCNNVFLDDSLNVKLGDFAGSSIDDLPPLTCYETSHELPGADISTKTDLFAVGSTTYEIMTGSKPYKNLPEHEVSAAFTEGRYPDLGSVSAFKNIITKCWKQSYADPEEALIDVKLEVAAINKSDMSQVQILLRQPLLFPFLLTAVCLVPMVGWVRHWKLLK